MEIEIKTKIRVLRKSRKKPDFLVRESKFSAGVKSRWRHPYGRHSAVRQMHKGRPALPHPGYGAPKSIFGLHYTGLREVLVYNTKDITQINPVAEGAVISSTVGVKNKLRMLEVAKEKNISVLNLRNVDTYASEIKKDLSERKKAKEEKLKIKSKKLEEKKKKAEQKEKKEKESSAKADKEEGENSKDILSSEDEKTAAETAKEEERRLMEETITKRQ